MAVGVPGKHLFGDELLDLAQRPARRDVVGVDERMRAERAGNGDALADQPGAQAVKDVRGAKRGAQGGEGHGDLRLLMSGEDDGR